MTEQLATFTMKILHPDSRQYRQNSIELEPVEIQIGVYIPLTKEYIHNAEAILSAQLGSGNVDVPKPIYTNKALRFFSDYLGEHLTDPEDVKPEDFKSNDLDWSSDEKDVGKQLGEALSEDWGGTEKEVNEVWKEVNEVWKEADTDTGLLPWDEKEEDWS